VGVGIVVVFVVVVMPLLLVFSSGRNSGDRCARQMKQIGGALLLYAMDHGHRYPPDLGTLLAARGLPTEVVVCPGSGQTPARSAAAGDLAGHVSYVYIGGGMTDRESADTVVLYEPMSNHGGAGMYVLFGDGRIEFLDKAGAGKMLEGLRAGRDRPGAGTRPTGRE
jgi:hypothetical protein